MFVSAFARVSLTTARTPTLHQHAHGAQSVDYSTWGQRVHPNPLPPPPNGNLLDATEATTTRRGHYQQVTLSRHLSERAERCSTKYRCSTARITSLQNARSHLKTHYYRVQQHNNVTICATETFSIKIRKPLRTPRPDVQATHRERRAISQPANAECASD